MWNLAQENGLLENIRNPSATQNFLRIAERIARPPSIALPLGDAFLSRVCTLTRDIDIAILSVCHLRPTRFYRDSLTYCRSFFHDTGNGPPVRRFFVKLLWPLVIILSHIVSLYGFVFFLSVSGFCRAMLCKHGLCRHACLSVRPPVTFVDSVAMNKYIFTFFSPLYTHTILVFHTKRHGNIPTGIP